MAEDLMKSKEIFECLEKTKQDIRIKKAKEDIEQSLRLIFET